jgi:hypothetical protein
MQFAAGKPAQVLVEVMHLCSNPQVPVTLQMPHHYHEDQAGHHQEEDKLVHKYHHEHR